MPARACTGKAPRARQHRAVGRLSTAPAPAEATRRGDLPAFRSDRRDRPDPVQHVPTPPRPPRASTRAIITPRIAGAPLHLRIDSGRTTPARPSARAPGSRAAPIASAPAAHASGNRGSHQSSATRAAQQVPTASSSSAPQNRTRSPVLSARPLCPSHGPLRAAASHLHSELRHALHTAHTRPPETSTAPAPPLPTRCTLPQHSTRAYGV